VTVWGVVWGSWDSMPWYVAELFDGILSGHAAFARVTRTGPRYLAPLGTGPLYRILLQFVISRGANLSMRLTAGFEVQNFSKSDTVR
jgi:hypothetical protein